MKKMSVLLTLVLISSLIFAQSERNTPLLAQATTEAESPAPTFSLKNLAGETVNLSDFQGKVVYIDFWASWCGPCRYEMSFSHALQEEFTGNEDVVFMYISLDENEAKWKKAADDLGLKGIILHAPGKEDQVGSDYDIKFIPRYVIIGKDGTLIENQAARPSQKSEAVKQIRKALDRKA